jgi:hypothetical protein
LAIAIESRAASHHIHDAFHSRSNRIVPPVILGPQLLDHGNSVRRRLGHPVRAVIVTDVAQSALYRDPLDARHGLYCTRAVQC